MAGIAKVTTDGIPNGPLAEKEIGYDLVDGELYIGSGTGTADGIKNSIDAGEHRVTRNKELADLDAAAVKLTGAQSIDGVKTFTESPVAPTPTAGDDSTKLATTAFVNASTDTTAISYFGYITANITTAGIITGFTDELDTNSAMLSGVYTIPKDGKYKVDFGANFTWSTDVGATINCAIQLNGSAKTRIYETNNYVTVGSSSKRTHPSISCVIDCVVGDTIRVNVTTNTALIAAGARDTTLSINYQGV